MSANENLFGIVFVKVNCTFVVCVGCVCVRVCVCGEHIESDKEAERKKGEQPKIELRKENSCCAAECV